MPGLIETVSGLFTLPGVGTAKEHASNFGVGDLVSHPLLWPASERKELQGGPQISL